MLLYSQKVTAGCTPLKQGVVARGKKDMTLRKWVPTYDTKRIPRRVREGIPQQKEASRKTEFYI